VRNETKRFLNVLIPVFLQTPHLHIPSSAPVVKDFKWCT